MQQQRASEQHIGGKLESTTPWSQEGQAEAVQRLQGWGCRGCEVRCRSQDSIHCCISRRLSRRVININAATASVPTFLVSSHKEETAVHTYDYYLTSMAMAMARICTVNDYRYFILHYKSWIPESPFLEEVHLMSVFQVFSFYSDGCNLFP